MEIVKSFGVYQDTFMGRSTVSVKVEVTNSTGVALHVFNIKEQMLTLNEEFVEAKDLVNKEFLQKYGVEFVIIDEKVVPVGLIEFRQGFSKNMSYLPIAINTVKEQCEIDEVLAQIETAIRYKYNGKLVIDKCKEKIQERTML